MTILTTTNNTSSLSQRLSEANLTELDKALAKINQQIKEQLEREKQFWIIEMQAAKTDITLNCWHDAMEKETVNLLKKYKIDDEIIDDWVNSCNSTWKDKSTKVIHVKSLFKNYSWPAMGLAIACVGVAAVASPLLAVASIAMGVSGVAYAVADTYSEMKHARNEAKTTPTIGQKKTNRLKIISSLGSLTLGGLVLGVVLTGVFPPAGIFVLAAVISAPFIIKLAVRGINTYRRQKELTATKEKTATMLHNLESIMEIQNQLKEEERKKATEAAKQQDQNGLEQKKQEEIQKTPEEELHLLSTLKPPAPNPQVVQAKKKQEEQEEAQEEEQENSQEEPLLK